MDWVKRLGEQADKAAQRAREMHKLTGQFDPLLIGVKVQLEDGTWRCLGNVRLSEIGHWQVVTADQAVERRSQT